MATLLVSAGDASGDQHAAALVRDLRKRRPEDRIVGLGGPALQAEGVELVASQNDLGSDLMVPLSLDFSLIVFSACFRGLGSIILCHGQG